MQCDTTHLKALDPKNIYPTLKSVKNKSTRTKGNFNQMEEVNHKQKKKNLDALKQSLRLIPPWSRQSASQQI